MCVQTCSGNYRELHNALCNLHFIEAKSSLGLAPQLLEDFQVKGHKVNKVNEKERAKFLETEHVRDYLSFVSSNVHILAR